MEDKILITVNVPLLDEKYDIFIPINKKFGTVKKYIIDTINELTSNGLKNSNSMNLYDKETCRLYDSNIYVKNSDIKNGTVLVLI